MKKAEEYLKEVNSFTTRERLYEIGKQIQIDAINDTVKRCAENVIIKSFKLSKYSKTPRWKLVKDEEIDLFFYDFKTEVDKQSILKAAEELKKELE